MIYLIFGELFSGIIAGQALDVCKYISSAYLPNSRVIVFVPLKNYRKHKSKYKDYLKKTTVIPLIFGSRRFKLYLPILLVISLIFYNKSWIGRGVKATYLLNIIARFGIIKSVIYDGRGAHAAETKEYFKNKYNMSEVKINREIEYERKAITESNYRIAVSKELVSYWRREYNYLGENHVVIPCTLNKTFLEKYPTPKQITSKRNELGYNEDDVVLAFVGSVAGWQSFHLLDKFFCEVLRKQKNLKILMFSKITLEKLQSYQQFPDRIQKKWVKVEEVYLSLSICDYGILFRENTITNKVSSPVKFAEYLASGLKVLITENIGDYSSMVFNENLGLVISNSDEYLHQKDFRKTTYIEKSSLNNFAQKYFKKVTFNEEYRQVLYRQ